MARQPKTRATTPAASKQASAPVNGIPLSEWISAGIGLALMLIVLGVIAWDALLGERSPAVIEVRLVAVHQTPYGFVAQIEAINHGGAAATQVEVSGTLGNSGAPDAAEATFDYIPEKSSARGALVFAKDPRAGGLVLRARSYVDAG